MGQLKWARILFRPRADVRWRTPDGRLGSPVHALQSVRVCRHGWVSLVCGPALEESRLYRVGLDGDGTPVKGRKGHEKEHR